MNKPLSAVSLFVATALTLAGCGGGGGGGHHSSSSSSTAPVSFTVEWPTRSRATAAPSSALSARLTISGGGSDGGDLSYTVDRNAAPAGYTQTYTTPTGAKTGTRTATLQFYAAANGAGALVATGTTQVAISKTSADVGTVVLANTVKTVRVLAGQGTVVGSTTQLTFQALDASGNLVAVSPGSAVFTQNDGSASFSLSAAGVVTATAAGSGNVTATVDGVTSANALVSVTQAAIASVTVDSGQRIAVGQSVQLTFTAKDASGNVVNIPDTSATWTNALNDPDLTLTPTGLATGSQTGTVTVTATVNGVASPATVVTVYQP